MYVDIENQVSTVKVRLFDKKNWWWYDSIYYLARFGKWFDSDRFGISFGKGKFEIWYSIDKNEVFCYEHGKPVDTINFGNFFMLDKPV
jgi:hypothetical protein